MRAKLQFPAGGVVKRLAYSETPEKFTPSAQNVRPDCSLLTRERGGSRPGLVKYSSSDIGSTVRLITEAFYTSSGAYAKQLLASASGTLYKYSAGSFSSVTMGGITLTSDRPLMAADLLNKLYIASDNHADERPVVYDPATDTCSLLTATAGTIPTKCWILVRYRDRILMAGDRANPHLIYASRQSDPQDWDDTETDDQAAWTLSTADAGAIGEPVTALIPHGDDCCIIGCGSSLWVLRSDVTYGGSVDNLSRSIGIIDYHAYCHDSEGNLWFVGHDGLYFMPAGCGSMPVSVSRERVPEELLGIDRTATTVSVSYDLRDRGIHIVLNGTSKSAWFADVRTTADDSLGPQASFWPQTYQDDHYAHFQYHRRDEGSTKSLSLWGGADGYIRHHDHTASQDDGSNAITSYVYYSLPLAPDGHEGVLSKLECVTAANSGDVDIAVYVGKTPETAFNASAFGTYEFNTAGWNPPKHPRARGNAAMLKVGNGEANAEWSLEEIAVDIESGGQRR